MLKNSIIIGALIICLTGLLLVGGFFLQNDKTGNEDIVKSLDSLNLKRINKVMIVAHPDDEMLWGGNHLVTEKYLVVCVTCGDSQERELEFESVMEKVNCPYLSLYYPDRSKWENDEKYIINDLQTIFKYKEFEEFVTHNPDGEYGHYQHQMVSAFTTSLVPKEKLYYFNHYYTEKELKSKKVEYEEDSVKKVEEVLENYKSQKEIINNHKAMIPYEHFIPYKEWN